MSRVAHSCRLFLVVGIGMAIGLGISSQTQRIVHPAILPPDLVISDRELRWVPNPEHPWNNSLGFRGDEIPLEKPAGIIRIAFLGDSTTFNVRERDGYVEMLNKWHQGEGCDFINAAVPGLDAAAIYARYERDVLPLEPDVVIAALPALQYYKIRPSIGADILRVILKDMADLASAHEETFFVLAMPINLSSEVPPVPIAWGPADLEVQEEYHRALYEVMQESGDSLLDARQLQWQAEEFRDSTHLTDDGLYHLAQWLDGELIAELCAPERLP